MSRPCSCFASGRSECACGAWDEDYQEQLQQAHRQGWEQCQREADSLLLDLLDVVLESKTGVQSARKAIAAMEYKEPEND